MAKKILMAALEKSLLILLYLFIILCVYLVIAPLARAESPKTIALTFDDGPRPAVLKNLLPLLWEHKVQATFFVVGKSAASRQEWLKKISAAGHGVENHSWGHENFKKLYASGGAEAVKTSVLEAEREIISAIGIKPCFFRPPYLAIDEKIEKIISGLGYVVMLAGQPDLDSGDCADFMKKHSPEILSERVKKIIAGRETKGKFSHVLLFHELPITVEALKIIIPHFQNNGYRFVKIDCREKTGEAEKSAAIKWEYYTLKKGDVLENIFGESWPDVLRFNRIDRNHLWPGKKIKRPLNLEDIKNFAPLSDFYEPAAPHKKYVFINLGEQFLGCYEFGYLKLSFPVASGRKNYGTPKGDFKVLARHRDHFSSQYKISGTNIPYPMTWAIKFYVSKSGVSFWIHGRDMPGYPASHGCIGLYDEEMQKKYYKRPANPVLMDAKKFYLWLFPGEENDGNLKAVSEDIPIRIL